MWGERCRDVGLTSWYRECRRSIVWGEGDELRLDVLSWECLSNIQVWLSSWTFQCTVLKL